MPTAEEIWLALAPATTAASEADRHERLIARVRAAQAAGAARVWIALERPGASAHEAISLAASVAAATADGTSPLRVVAADLRPGHWIRLAEDVATADGVCGGRLELAFAVLPDAELVARLREAWSGARLAVSRSGSGGSRDANGDAPLSRPGLAIEIHPRPPRPDGPPLWARVRGAGEAAHAARLELGAIAGPEDPAAVAEAHSAASPSGPPLAFAFTGDPADSHRPTSRGPRGAIALVRESVGQEPAPRSSAR